MNKRSLQVQEQYKQQANNAFISLGLTQKEFAEARLQLSRSTVSNFLRCKSVSKENFIKICNALQLDWKEITGLKEENDRRVDNVPMKEAAENIDNLSNAHRETDINRGNYNETIHGNFINVEGNLIQQTQSDPQTPASSPVDINTLVTQLRQQVKADIETRCGTMRIFDMTQPIGLGKIYTQVNILEKIIGRRRKEIAELIKNCNLEDFERFNLGRVTEEKISGKNAVTKYSKLLILGKPGAGKTTFLKHLAIQCNQGEFQGDLVPFFVTLKDFAETADKPDLLTYLGNYIESDNSQNLKQILNHKKTLILLDGLDEVLDADSKRVIKEIENLTNKYPGNQYVMTCRIAAKEYTFEKFTEVEIADFDWSQITTFAQNWFKDKPVNPESFITRLEKDKLIKELVSSPLLLTLLCISFEELGDFPANCKELYEEGLDALLKKWDAKRGIQRDKVYKPLSVAKKEDLLSNIAWKTFAPGDYFFKVDQVKRYISEYIRNLPGANLDDEALQGDSGIVLKNIEAQHGLLVARAKNIYSFSHLTFQEYFTAREIILVRQSSDEALEELVDHLFEKRWREVFLLAVAMSPNAERLVLLMKEKIDALLADNFKLQDLLNWATQKSSLVRLPFTKTSIRCLYLDLVFKLFRVPNFNFSLFRFAELLDDKISPISLPNDYAIDRDLLRSLNEAIEFRNKIEDIQNQENLYQSLYDDINNKNASNYYLGLPDLAFDITLFTNAEMQKVFKKVDIIFLKNEVYKLPIESQASFLMEWWICNGDNWIENLRKLMIKHRKIGHSWKFSIEQKISLSEYFYANQLLIQCLHQDCYVSPEVRQEIEETLLLPIAKIEKSP